MDPIRAGDNRVRSMVRNGIDAVRSNHGLHSIETCGGHNPVRSHCDTIQTVVGTIMRPEALHLRCTIHDQSRGIPRSHEQTASETLFRLTEHVVPSPRAAKHVPRPALTDLQMLGNNRCGTAMCMR